jgi:hypothetical protein
MYVVRLVVWPSMTLGHGAGSQVLIMLPMTLIASAPTFFFRDVLITSA